MISKKGDRLDFHLGRSIEPNHDLAASGPDRHRTLSPRDIFPSDRPRDTTTQRAAPNRKVGSDSTFQK